MDQESNNDVPAKIREIIQEIIRILKEGLAEIFSSWKVGDEYDSPFSSSGGNPQHAGKHKGDGEFNEGRCDDTHDCSSPKYEFDIHLQGKHAKPNSAEFSYKGPEGKKKGSSSMSMKLRRRDTEDIGGKVFLHE